MRADNNGLGDYGITLNPQEGTVAAYLEKPTPPALHRRVAGLLICLALMLIAVAALSIYMRDHNDVQLLLPLWSFYPYEIALGCISAGAATAILICSRMRNLPQEDRVIAVKKVALDALIKCGRLGLGPSTTMRSARVESRWVFGAWGKAVRCKRSGFKFAPQDFYHIKPADFGVEAVDFEVADNGCLYVYFDYQTAERQRERHYKKGRG